MPELPDVAMHHNGGVSALLKTVCRGRPGKLPADKSCPAVFAHLPRIREKARPFGRDESRPYDFSTDQGVSSFPRGYIVKNRGGHDSRGTKPLAAM